MTKRNKNESEELQYIPINDPTLVFTTYDLGVACALLCLGFKLLELDKANPRKALFVFEKEGGIEDFANDYLTNKLDVKARSFFDQIKAVKNSLYS